MHSPEKEESPETFAEKVNEICDLYLNAQEMESANVHVISVDEMTGIQALEHKHPYKLPIPGISAEMEFEYIRYGSISLIGLFNVATSSMCSPTLIKREMKKIFTAPYQTLLQPHSWIHMCLYVKSLILINQNP